MFGADTFVYSSRVEVCDLSPNPGSKSCSWRKISLLLLEIQTSESDFKSSVSAWKLYTSAGSPFTTSLRRRWHDTFLAFLRFSSCWFCLCSAIIGLFLHAPRTWTYT